MTDSTRSHRGIPAWLDRLTPRAHPHAQLVSAAVMWLIGSAILLVRGVGFLHARWFAALVALAIVLGMVKSRYLLDRVARKAVARIRERGKACYFGFFSWKSWGFVALMMGGGIFLRNSGLPKDLLAVVYVAVGTALAMADRIFWMALFAGKPIAEAAAE